MYHESRPLDLADTSVPSFRAVTYHSSICRSPGAMLASANAAALDVAATGVQPHTAHRPASAGRLLPVPAADWPAAGRLPCVPSLSQRSTMLSVRLLLLGACLAAVLVDVLVEAVADPARFSWGPGIEVKQCQLLLVLLLFSLGGAPLVVSAAPESCGPALCRAAPRMVWKPASCNILPGTGARDQSDVSDEEHHRRLPLATGSLQTGIYTCKHTLAQTCAHRDCIHSCQQEYMETFNTCWCTPNPLPAHSHYPCSAPCSSSSS